MSSVIRLLPDHVANQIAAGEVVQRPASVVKELLENSVDAGATSIQLIIKDAGKTLIHVVDNGKGMNETDARMCFERHATSKISMAEDLFQLQTKGFRGEALASIAAIAHVELKTKTVDAELGTHVTIEGSKIISQEPAVVPNGTSFSVKNLFFNIPARRNFLKSDQVELRHVVDEFERVALAHPSIQFVFINNGSEMFHLPSSNLRQRIVNVFGGRTNEKLVPVSESTEIVTIEGFVTKPEFAKKSRGEQFFFVNDRFIKSGYLNHAITSAFEGLLKEGTHPSYFLYLQLPANSIDINIHPTKTEVKFEDEKALYAILRASIKHSLGQFQVARDLDFDRDPSLDFPYEMKDKIADMPTISVDANYNPFEFTDTSGVLGQSLSTASLASKAFDQGFYNPFDDIRDESPKSNSLGSKVGAHFSNKNSSGPAPSHSHWETLYQGITDAKQDIWSAQQFIEKEIEQESLFQVETLDNLSTQVAFQFNKKYIISPIKSGMMMIDQRRAHQRILYEEYLNKLKNRVSSSQQLLFPLNLYYSKYELELVKQVQDELLHMGFIFDGIDDEKVTISGIPVTIIESEVSIVLEDLLNELQTEFPSDKDVLLDRMAKSMAQSLAVKSGAVLNREEQENIVNSLFACSDPQVSPFGKTTFVTMSVEDIDKKFM